VTQLERTGLLHRVKALTPALVLGAAVAAAILALSVPRDSTVPARALPARAAPPSAAGAPESSAQTRPQNRLFPAQELGLIEPPDRDEWQPPELIMDDLNIAEGAVVADLGAGGGWFTIQLARRVAQNGLVYAEDVQPAMLDAIRRRAQRENLFNVRTVLGTANDPKLPHGLDAAIIVDVYHEMACAAKPSCDEPVAVLKNVARSLKPQGRLGIVDFFPGEGGPGPAPEERVDPDTVVRAAAAAGLQVVKRRALPPFQFQYLLVFGHTPNARVLP